MSKITEKQHHHHGEEAEAEMYRRDGADPEDEHVILLLRYPVPLSGATEMAHN